ncbi:hypothetical protein FOZ62_015227, partial [Perkinsus olseni]
MPNYVTGDGRKGHSTRSQRWPLRGACADAFLTAHTLQSLLDFSVEDIRVLYDEHPPLGPGRPLQIDPIRLPTRMNLLQALRWLDGVSLMVSSEGALKQSEGSLREGLLLLGAL